MAKYNSVKVPKSERITRLVEHLYAKLPEIESARAVLLTESYRQTEDEPEVMRMAKAFAHILDHIPIIIREEELIVGSSTIAPRGCQTFPEFSFEWLESEFDTVATREADPFYISEQAKKEIAEVDKYWKGKTTSELATSYMAPETLRAMAHNMFTPGNYFYNGVGHVTVQYEKVLAVGFEGIMEEVRRELASCSVGDADYATKHVLLESMLISCAAVIRYANRYADLAESQAAKCGDGTRKQELLTIAANCRRVPAKGAETFWEACQSFWFVQQLLQMESSGHSISPGRFDQYMYPYYQADLEAGRMTREQAQELIDCVWVKLNDLNKCRDAESAKGFAGYSLFQNLIVGGQNAEGLDVTNDLSFMCIDASAHVFLPQPSLSIRVWNGSPHELLVRAAELTRTGIGLPAYYNDEVIIPSLMSRGLTLEDARTYNIIGCVEPQKAGKTWGWHDAAFYNMCVRWRWYSRMVWIAGSRSDPRPATWSRCRPLRNLRCLQDPAELLYLPAGQRGQLHRSGSCRPGAAAVSGFHGGRLHQARQDLRAGRLRLQLYRASGLRHRQCGGFPLRGKEAGVRREEDFHEGLQEGSDVQLRKDRRAVGAGADRRQCGPGVCGAGRPSGREGGNGDGPSGHRRFRDAGGSEEI